MIKSARTGWLIAWVVALGELGTATPGAAQVFGEAARTEFFGGLGVRVFYGRINNTRLLSDGESIANPTAPESSSTRFRWRWCTGCVRGFRS